MGHDAAHSEQIIMPEHVLGSKHDLSSPGTSTIPSGPSHQLAVAVVDRPDPEFSGARPRVLPLECKLHAPNWMGRVLPIDSAPSDPITSPTQMTVPLSARGMPGTCSCQTAKLAIP